MLDKSIVYAFLASFTVAVFILSLAGFFKKYGVGYGPPKALKITKKVRYVGAYICGFLDPRSCGTVVKRI